MIKAYDFIYIDGDINTLLINFSSKGIEESNRVIAELTKPLKQLNCRVGFAMDTTKSWFCNDETVTGIKNEITYLQEETIPEKTIFMGLSMGGFGAILFSYTCKCDKVIAFSPQIDIDPKLTNAWDNRYIKYLSSIEHFTVPHIRNHFKNNIEYELICGENDIDQKHISLCPNTSNITKTTIQTAGHNPLKCWKDKGILEKELKKLILENN